jgi:hypothetical protein
LRQAVLTISGASAVEGGRTALAADKLPHASTASAQEVVLITVVI